MKVFDILCESDTAIDDVNGQQLKSGPPYPKEDIPAVKIMQRRLAKLGYSVGSTGVDGKYGPRTAAAVRAFKKDNNISGGGQSVDVAAIKNAKPVANPHVTGKEAPGGEMGLLKQDTVTKGKIGEVLNLIAGPESGGKYDAVYPSKQRPQILDMTLDELFRDMRARGNKYNSSASGRYQYIRKTLQGVTSSMGLDTATTKFTPKVQDQIAIYHLRRSHGLDKWLAGGMSNEDFLNRLAGTWAGIPQTNGRSKYAGVLDNKAGMGAQAALSQLDSIKGVA